MFYLGSILLSLAVVEIVMAAVLATFWRMQSETRGLKEMAGAMGIGSVGGLLTAFGASNADFRFGLIGILCFVVAVLLAARSMRRLRGVPPSYALELGAFVFCVVCDGYFLLVEKRIAGALAANSMAYAVISGFTAKQLFTERRQALRSGCLFLGYVFAIFGAINAIRAVVQLVDGIPTPVYLPTVSFDFVFVVFGIAVSISWSLGLLWTSYSIAEHQLRTANDKLARFTGAVAHDLNAPLNAIIGYLEAVEHMPAMAEQHKAGFIKSAHEAAQRMNTFIHQLLEYSRMAEVDPVLEVVDTGACMRDAVKPLQAKFADIDADVHIPDLHSVQGSALQITRVFQNLLDNAIKYRADDRPLRIHVSSDLIDAWVVVSVKDNGRGVAPTDRKKIFQRFERAGDPHAVQGYGLGLSECRRIIESFDGTIDVASEHGAGATFIIKLPAASV